MLGCLTYPDVLSRREVQEAGTVRGGVLARVQVPLGLELEENLCGGVFLEERVGVHEVFAGHSFAVPSLPRRHQITR